MKFVLAFCAAALAICFVDAKRGDDGVDSNFSMESRYFTPKFHISPPGKTMEHKFGNENVGYFTWKSRVKNRCLALAPAFYNNRKSFKKHPLNTGKGLKGKALFVWNKFRHAVHGCKYGKRCFNRCFSWHMMHYWKCDKADASLKNADVKCKSNGGKCKPKGMGLWMKKKSPTNINTKIRKFLENDSNWGKKPYPVQRNEKWCYRKLIRKNREKPVSPTGGLSTGPAGGGSAPGFGAGRRRLSVHKAKQFGFLKSMFKPYNNGWTVETECEDPGTAKFFGHYPRCKKTLGDYWTFMNRNTGGARVQIELKDFVTKCDCIKKPIKQSSQTFKGLGIPAFCWLDTNENEVVTPAELKAWMQHIEQPAAATFLMGQFKQFDADNDNAITLHEYAQAIHYLSSGTKSLDFNELFNVESETFCNKDMVKSIWIKGSQPYNAFASTGRMDGNRRRLTASGGSS